MSAPVELTPALLRGMALPDPAGGDPAGGDKEKRGRVLVVAGSAEVPGAALLAGTAVLRAGAGKLQIGAGRSVATQLAIAVPESRVFALAETESGAIAPAAAAILAPRARQCAAMLVGPGMVEPGPAAALARGLLAAREGTPIVLDAAAMAALGTPDGARPATEDGPVIITPHAGELAHLLGIGRDAIGADPAGHARAAAERFAAVVVLKGAETHVAAPGGALHVFRGGTIGLATSGSGDVLAGLIAGLLGRGAGAVQAVLWGVHLHGAAGRRLARAQAPLGFLARELPAELPGLLAGLGRA